MMKQKPLADRLGNAGFTKCPGCVHAFNAWALSNQNPALRGVCCAQAATDKPVPLPQANRCTKVLYASSANVSRELPPQPPPG